MVWHSQQANDGITQRGRLRANQDKDCVRTQRDGKRKKKLFQFGFCMIETRFFFLVHWIVYSVFYERRPIVAIVIGDCVCEMYGCLLPHDTCFDFDTFFWWIRCQTWNKIENYNIIRPCYGVTVLSMIITYHKKRLLLWARDSLLWNIWKIY